MSSAANREKPARKQADEARSALLSDIQEIRKVGHEAVAKVETRLPWAIGGAVGLVLVGIAVAVVRSRRRSAFVEGERAWARKAVRAAAVSAASLLGRRLLERSHGEQPRMTDAGAPTVTNGS